MTSEDLAAAPKPLGDRVMAIVRATATGCSLSDVQGELPDIEPREVRAMLTTLRNSKLLIGGMSEGEPFYKTPAQIPQTQPGTALRALPQEAKVPKGRGGEATSQAMAITGEAGESPAAPRATGPAPRKTARATTNEKGAPMPPKGKHDAESHRGAIRRAVLAALGASGDKHSTNALQNAMSPQRRLSARQMANALARLQAGGLVKKTGRGRATEWQITAKGTKEIAEPADQTGELSSPKKAKRKARPVKVRRSYRRKLSRVPATSAIAKDKHGQPELSSPSETTASFTKDGGILITGPHGAKRLEKAEALEVAELVLAFNKPGLLLPEDASRSA